MYIEEWILQAHLRVQAWISVEEYVIRESVRDIRLEEDRRMLKDLESLYGMQVDPKFIESSFVFNPALRPEDLKPKERRLKASFSLTMPSVGDE